jgi:hypothetical protein
VLLNGGALSPGGLLWDAFGNVVPGGIPWLPTMEPSLRLWIDPSDTTGWTLNASGNPTAIRSKAVTQDVLALFTGNAAILSGNSLGFPTAAGYQVSNRLGFAEADPPMAVVVVATPGANSATNRLLALGGTGVGHGPQLILSSGEYAWRYGSGEIVFPAVNGSGQVLLSAITNPGLANGAMRADGTTLTATSSIAGSTTDAFARFRIFFNFVGNASHMLVFASTSQTLIERAEGYLAHKHNRAAQLPANHPFKSSPPMVP